MDLRWKCKDCDECFKTKAKLYEHRHEIHNIKTRDRSNVCKFCKEKYEGTAREHLKICSSRRHKGFRWTDEEKKMLSEKRKAYLKEHPDEHPWKRNTKFKSKPCEHLKNILKQKFEFEEEYTDTRWEHNYSIDIAFLDKKLAIEVNGNQHYTNEGKLNTYFQNRHDYLISKGWQVLEIHYANCYKLEKIEEIKNAIINEKDIDYYEHQLLFANKTKILKEKQIEKEEKQKYAKENGLIKCNGKINGCGVTFDEWNKRKDLILNSGIDLTKYGWVGKVIEKTKLSKRIIENTVKRFEELKMICFKRQY